MNRTSVQAELFGLVWHPPDVYRLRAGDVFLFDGRFCRVIRVNVCDAVVMMHRPKRVFLTRFDKPVSFQPSPAIFRISPNSEVEVLNRKGGNSAPQNHY